MPPPARRPAASEHRCCSRRRSGRRRGLVARVPCPDRRAGCSTTAATEGRLAACPRSVLSRPRPSSIQPAGSDGAAAAPVVPRPGAPPVPSARHGSPGRRTFPSQGRRRSVGPRPRALVRHAPHRVRCAPDGSRRKPWRSLDRTAASAPDASPAGSADPPPSGCPIGASLRRAWGFPPRAPAAAGCGPPSAVLPPPEGKVAVLPWRLTHPFPALTASGTCPWDRHGASQRHRLHLLTPSTDRPPPVLDVWPFAGLVLPATTASADFCRPVPASRDAGSTPVAGGRTTDLPG